MKSYKCNRNCAQLLLGTILGPTRWLTHPGFLKCEGWRGTVVDLQSAEALHLSLRGWVSPLSPQLGPTTLHRCTLNPTTTHKHSSFISRSSCFSSQVDTTVVRGKKSAIGVGFFVFLLLDDQLGVPFEVSVSSPFVELAGELGRNLSRLLQNRMWHVRFQGQWIGLSRGLRDFVFLGGV